MNEVLGRRWTVLLEGIHSRPVWSAAVSGALLPLGFAPASFWWLPPLVLAALLWLIIDLSPGRAARVGWAHGSAGFLTGTYWLYNSLHVFGKAPLVVALFLMIGLVALMGAYTAAFAWGFRRLEGGRDARSMLLVVPGLWILIEWWRGWFMSGFPWLSQGYAHVDAPLGGLAPILGVYGVGLAAVMSGSTLLWMALNPKPWRGLLVLLPIWGLGLATEHMRWTEPEDAILDVALVQGNVAQDQKWVPENLLPTMELYWDLSEEHWDADVVIWPEAAIPALLRHYDETYLADLEVRAQETDTTFVMGALRYSEETEQFYNSLLATGTGAGRYDKRHLVPFGEYFPVPAFVRGWMRLMALPYEDFAPGDDDPVPLLDIAGWPAAASICYEDAYGAELRDAASRSALLVNVSNDAWFGTSIAPHQHLQVTRFRAREAGRPMLRATNTGVTTLIGPGGELLERLPQFEAGVLRVEVRPYRGLTPWLRWGDWPALAFALLMVLAGVFLRRRDG